MVAAVFESRMAASRRSGCGAHAPGTGHAARRCLAAALLVDGDLVRLVAFWKDRDTLDRYLSSAPAPRGTELMRKVGVEPEVRIVDVLEL
jgi:hypothetical protein